MNRVLLGSGNSFLDFWVILLNGKFCYEVSSTGFGWILEIGNELEKNNEVIR
ncbi:hypothetical protein RhiirA4_479633 [Rhizophagus irregularis]|uniref:Uncharacterized protein n=1 Tax=Rhizophagus irregularis TaxID=588596 RepID=A0A2I1HGQ2_9GLOM|nr:hypothetical protein RhiirA4_479633 [Rhizophagus irregularis]